MTANDDIIDLVAQIIRKCNFIEPIDIKYYPGSDIGDGFASKTIAVDIKNGKKSLNLFLKYALNVKSTMPMQMEKIYVNEAYFYNTIYPAYAKFSKNRNIDCFKNVPKCYGTSDKNIVALENLRKRNFVLFDKTQSMNRAHLEFVIKTFAKFHAISFSFKDQETEKYEELVKDTFDFFLTNGNEMGFDKMLHASITDFLSKLDPITDKHILDSCSNIADELTEIVYNGKRTLNKYSILTQGDCWVNNMMFQYEENDREIPKDMMLIDWQLVRQASPVFDLSYFFYTIAPKEAQSKLSEYLEIYHKELSKRIIELGSDPNELYPYNVFEAEWKKYGKYGFGMSFMLLKVMLYTKEELPSLEDMDMEQLKENPELVFPSVKNDEEYIKRLRNLAEHFIENDFL